MRAKDGFVPVRLKSFPVLPRLPRACSGPKARNKGLQTQSIPGCSHRFHVSAEQAMIEQCGTDGQASANRPVAGASVPVCQRLRHYTHHHYKLHVSNDQGGCYRAPWGHIGAFALFARPHCYCGHRLLVASHNTTEDTPTGPEATVWLYLAWVAG